MNQTVDHAANLEIWELAVAGALILLAGIISLVLRLDLEKRLAVAVVRVCLQLTLTGFVLKYVFAAENGAVVLLILLLMLLVAARNAVARPGRTYRGAFAQAFFTLILSGLVTGAFITQVVIRVDPWYEPRYVIPLLGMILGNSLTGIALALDQMLQTLVEQRLRIETDLALGATRWEAARGVIVESVRRGMIPTINSMMVMGIVFLPGMMTGQILGGESPLGAVKYQILIMFAIAGAVALGCIGLTLLTYRRLFNHRHQLDLSIVRTQKS